MKIKPLFTILLTSLLLFCCKEKDSEKNNIVGQSNSEEYKEEDYKKVQGVILKKVTRYKRSFFDSYKKGDIYYIYNLDLDEPQIGVEKNSELMFYEDDIVAVMVNKYDSSVSFIGHRGIVDQELLYQYLTRTDSNYYKMKNHVPFKK